MGTILRLLILAGIIWFIYSFIKRTLLVTQRPSQQTAAPLMRQCAHCGLHIPQQEAIVFDNLFFCDETHKQQYLQRKP